MYEILLTLVFIKILTQCIKNALIGGLAGGISTVITQPMVSLHYFSFPPIICNTNLKQQLYGCLQDVVKTRVMTSSNSIGMLPTAYKV